MKKDSIRAIACGAVILVIYHLIAFLIPFVHSATFWISYGFTLAGIGVMGAALYLGFLKPGNAKSKFYGFPIARIGLLYGLGQLVIGLLFMALGMFIPYWVSLIIFAIGLGAATLGLISADAMREQVEVADDVTQEKIALMRGLQSRVTGLVAAADADTAKVLTPFADELRYSDPVSSEALLQIETELSNLVDLLQSAVVGGDVANVRVLVRKGMVTLAERNRQCKLNK